MDRLILLFLSMLATAALAQRSHHELLAEKNTPLQKISNSKIPETKDPQYYAVRPVDFNSTVMDFSPIPYQRGIAFVSSRPKKGSPSAESSFLSLYYTEEFEDGSFSIPEPLHDAGVTSYHEGPVVFYNNGRKKILTRNALIKKSKMRDGSEQTLELAQSELMASGKWSDPVSLPFASSDYSVAHPAISSDGRTLYFSSDMPGTLGESDIFVTKYENGSWSVPKNLGPEINTPGKEVFPYLMNDTLLFFSSSGHGGRGGLDIFFCNPNASRSLVSNFGSPINSDRDDFGIFLEADGNSGFFSSDRQGGAGNDDIYYFELIQPYIEIQLYDSTTHHFVRGAILTLITDGEVIGKIESDFMGRVEFRLNPLKHYKISVSATDYGLSQVEIGPSPPGVNRPAVIKVYLSPKRKRIETTRPMAMQSSERGSLTNVVTFSSSPLDIDIPAEHIIRPADKVAELEEDSVRLPHLEVIAVEVINDLPSVIIVKNDSIREFKRLSDSDLKSHDLNLDLIIPHGAKRNDFEEIISQQLLAQGYAIGKFQLIRSFFFDTGKVWVRNDASAQLDKIIEVLHAYPQIRLQMIFHADSRGASDFNMDLSRARSEKVTNYLMHAGIQKERIISNFVGERQLLNDCGDLSDCDELLHQINRTVEFRFMIP